MKAAIICGPRGGTGMEIVSHALDRLVDPEAVIGPQIPDFSYVVVGSYRGTDREAFEVIVEREMPALICPAKWKSGGHGNAEGPIRNRRMFAWVRPVVVLGFPGGPGTTDMMRVAREGSAPAYWWSQLDDLWVQDDIYQRGK